MEREDLGLSEISQAREDKQGMISLHVESESWCHRRAWDADHQRLGRGGWERCGGGLGKCRVMARQARGRLGAATVEAEGCYRIPICIHSVGYEVILRDLSVTCDKHLRRHYVYCDLTLHDVLGLIWTVWDAQISKGHIVLHKCAQFDLDSSLEVVRVTSRLTSHATPTQLETAAKLAAVWGWWRWGPHRSNLLWRDSVFRRRLPSSICLWKMCMQEYSQGPWTQPRW